VLVGILAIQGDYATHSKALSDIGVEVVEIRRAEDAGFANPSSAKDARKGNLVDPDIALKKIPDGMIIPGGESSTFDLLGRRYGLDKLFYAFAASGKTLFGTCAGAIWLGKGEHHKVKSLGLIDVDLERNAYGRQVDSFNTQIDIKGFDSPFDAVFIRAPKITRLGKDIEVLAEYKGDPVFVRWKNIWLTTFHPERTNDRRIHQLVFSG